MAAPTLDHVSASSLTGTTTTVTITSSANPSGYGQLLVLSATVIQATGTVIPDGSVTFTDGPTTLGTVTLDSLGQAALSESTLTAGTHSIVATYSGSATFDPSVSGTLSQVITAQGSMTMVISSLNPAAYGKTVIFIINVLASGGAAIPTGGVSLFDGAALIAATTLSSSGTAVVGTSTLAVGDHAISAHYLGDGNFLPSQGGLTETIAKAATSVGLASSANPSVLGSPVSFTATVAPASGSVPTGTVTFYDGSTVFGAGSLDSHGVAVFTTSGLGAGSHSITASYAGDGNFTGSSAAALTQVVNLPPTSTSLGSSANPAEYATPVTLTAAVTALSGIPTGSVAFTDGGAALGTAPLDAGGHASITVSTLSVGTHSLGAAYGGDAGFAASAAAPLSEMITAASASLAIATSVNPVVFGTPLTLTSSLSTNHPGAGGMVTFLDGSSSLGAVGLDATGHAALTLTTLSVGTHSLSARYAGDGNTAPAVSAPLRETVVTAPSGTALTSSINPAIVGQPITFTAAVTAGAAAPTGSVTFSDGSSSLGTVGLDATGRAALTVALAAGTHTITAVYSGDAHLGSSSATLSQVVNLIPTATELASSNNPATVTTPVTLAASVTAGGGGTPAGMVAFSDGGTLLGSAALDAGGHASLTTTALGIGLHHITATYGGDGVRYAASTSAALDQSITPIATTTGLSSDANPITVGSPVTLVASVSSATGATAVGVVTFLDGAATLASVAVAPDGTASFSTAALTTGAHTITAAFTGSPPFGDSASAPLTESVLPAASTVLLTSSANPSAYGSPVSLTATVSAASGGEPTGAVTFFDGTMSLGTATLSGGATTIVVSGMGGGLHALTASYAGDTNHTAATSPVLDQSVTAAATTTALRVTPNPARVGSPVLLTVAVSSGAGQPGGSVTFFDGATALGSVALVAGTAEMTKATLAKGVHALTAAYAGSADFASSQSATVNLQVLGHGDGCERGQGGDGGDDDRGSYRSVTAWERHRRRHPVVDCEPGDEPVVRAAASEDTPPRGRDGGRRD